ncbi:TetR/AcrR family transcriptional regulator [Chitinophaga agrisoli]|uniref:TetR/AcrR family transcriptional regulator n=1 Tax=Chitinophaga agrisoli TaxID=2607653 RepID=A0A5B2VIR8_9BACT|nr:TetR/AcrR family transcriptional regulator [Chitinophaga agrisoli]KAA2239483.1 TetR/AcrR family transcriptional regulator [Chitinophaga agrisoli]
MSQERNTEEQIIAAAKKIFIQKGLAGARMQDIADEAGINKAMLHYYYRSKEKLFDIVFDEALGKLIQRLGQMIRTNMPLEDKIRGIVRSYIEGLVENPHIPLFVLNELQQQPELLITKFKSRPDFPDLHQFLVEIAKASEAGIIKKISPVQLLLNILGMCVFPFVAKPLLQGIVGVDEVQFRLIIEERKQFVGDFIMAALTP